MWEKEKEGDGEEKTLGTTLLGSRLGGLHNSMNIERFNDDDVAILEAANHS
jgi:hypothetical protein